MKVVYTATAQRHIAGQLTYLIDRGASGPAKRLRGRIRSFVTGFLARYPRASRSIPDRDLFETWIPDTPYVLLYRVDDANNTLTVLALFHAAQDRSKFVPKEALIYRR